jgi:hypothetical protein
MPPGLFELVGVAGVIGTIAILATLAIVYIVKAVVDVWKRRQLVEIDIDATQHNIERLEITSDDRYKELVVKYDLRVEDLREARANISSLGEAKTVIEANLRRAADDNKKLEGERDDALTKRDAAYIERDEAKQAAQQATADCVALAEDYEARLQTLRNENAISKSMYEKRIDRLKKWIRRRGRDAKGCRDPC